MGMLGERGEGTINRLVGKEWPVGLRPGPGEVLGVVTPRCALREQPTQWGRPSPASRQAWARQLGPISLRSSLHACCSGPRAPGGETWQAVAFGGPRHLGEAGRISRPQGPGRVQAPDWDGHHSLLFAPLLCGQNLFDSIKSEPFSIPEDDGNDLTHTFFNPDREGWLLKLGEAHSRAH